MPILAIGFTWLVVGAAARQHLQSGDRVLSFGDATVLVGLHLSNAHKILHPGSKSGLGVLESEPGGVDGMVAALDSNPPHLITLARETKSEWTRPFYAWLSRRYVPVHVFLHAKIRFFVLRGK